MNIIPWRSKREGDGSRELAPLSQLRSEMDRLFDRFFREPFGEEWFAGLTTWAPPLDVSETDKEVIVRAEVPGIQPKDIDISIAGNMLTISGEKREEREEKGASYYHVERRSGSFRRTVPLPSSVDRDKVDADYSNGVLTIHMQKLPTARPRKISVKTGKALTGGHQS